MKKRKQRRRAKKDPTVLVNFKATPAQKARLVAKAKAAGMTMTALLVDHIGRVRITPRPDRKEMLLALGRIASNLNQLARWAAHNDAGADALKVCFRLVELGDELRAIEALVAGRGGAEEAAS